MTDSFRKDLKHLTWDEVYARQQIRAPLVEDWMDPLGLKPGDRVLDVGAGPGYVSLALAERVGADGTVIALDQSADALAYLERLQRERSAPQIRRVVADASAPDLVRVLSDVTDNRAIDAALITMVLHHAKEPVAMLRNVAQLLPPDAPAVVAEFHPEGPGEHGPPPEHRIAPDQLRQWCAEVGLDVVTVRRQSPEHYMMLVRRRRTA